MEAIFEILKSVLFGVVQGITEWLPISSTGHMILLDAFVKLNFSDAFMSTFLVVVQLGSILAVVALFFHKLNPFSPSKTKEERMDTVSLWIKVFIAVVPAGIIGILFDEQIESIFYNPPTVSLTLILYGVLFIFLESRNKQPKISDFKQLDLKTAFGIGLFQMLALIPGTSRSGATILGAVFLGASRFVASEFSFFLAIPMMFGASLLKLIKIGFAFSPLEWTVLLSGSIVAFLVSIWAIKFLLDYIKRHDFKAFGYYRIVLGIIVLLYFSLR